MDEYDEYDDALEDAEEWTPGTCDQCGGSTPEEMKAAVTGSIIPVCACAIGQGAGTEECRCG